MHLPIDHWRPRTRGDCVSGPRPCPYVGCKYHLATDVTRYGSARIDERELEDMPATCALDVADKGAHTAEEVAALLGVSTARVRQIETKLLKRLRRDPEIRRMHATEEDP